jgi:hypothetical protein
MARRPTQSYESGFFFLEEEKKRLRKKRRKFFGGRKNKKRRRKKNRTLSVFSLSLSLSLLFTSAKGVKPKMPSLVSRPMLLATWEWEEEEEGGRKGRKRKEEVREIFFSSCSKSSHVASASRRSLFDGRNC